MLLKICAISTESNVSWAPVSNVLYFSRSIFSKLRFNFDCATSESGSDMLEGCRNIVTICTGEYTDCIGYTTIRFPAFKGQTSFYKFGLLSNLWKTPGHAIPLRDLLPWLSKIVSYSPYIRRNHSLPSWGFQLFKVKHRAIFSDYILNACGDGYPPRNHSIPKPSLFWFDIEGRVIFTDSILDIVWHISSLDTHHKNRKITLLQSKVFCASTLKIVQYFRAVSLILMGWMNSLQYSPYGPTTHSRSTWGFL